jgi:acyl-homoserine lactone acylase PvdQ
MKMSAVMLAAAWLACAPQDPEIKAWEQQARSVTVVRDDWGIPHVRGTTDADAVFGMIYAQAEDDFNRVETNYLNAMGRLAEAEGEAEVYRDLRMKLFIDPDSLKAQYAASPDWLRPLMDAWAAGLNYYLYKHPDVTPRVITRFEPWMALSFTEGSIGGDIERVNLRQLEAFYGDRPRPQAVAPVEETEPVAEPAGSNGFAIAPSNSASRHALLWINPHTSFFFRAELQMTSEEGLNAYGAVTWGQFFVYQGFNETAGWMHTSSGVDNIDEYAETVVRRGEGYVYRYGREERPLVSSTIAVPFKTDTGVATKEFTVYRTHHGPVVREADGKWISIRLMQEPVKALTQSYTRTKAKNYQEFRETMELHTNSSNNTAFADAEGNIVYFHANFVPRRNARFDWRAPVDGSDPATEWQGVHAIDESPNVVNPANGWIQNTNNWPYSAAGAHSPRQQEYPAYMQVGGENARGIHAIRVLENKTDFTMTSLIAAAFDSYLTAFEPLIPSLIRAYDRTPAANPLKAKVSEQVALLREWDLRWSGSSVATSLAIAWGDELGSMVGADARRAGMSTDDYMVRRASPEQQLKALATASDTLTARFGTWKTAWGEINRFQRLTGDLAQPFNDSGPSIPVGFTSSRWGSLAAFGARSYRGSKKIYGTSGNSFVAAVEFGDSVRARAITAGGLNSDPASPHFNDQAVRYSTGDLREVYFYPSQLEGHTERAYRPGR